MSKPSHLIFDDLMKNVKIIYNKEDGLAYAKCDDIEAYLVKLQNKLKTKFPVKFSDVEK